jgi:hypothetical protein
MNPMVSIVLVPILVRSHDGCTIQAHFAFFYFYFCVCRIVATTVLVEGGRATADKSKAMVTANFHRAPPRMLDCATWFVRKEPNAKDKKTNLDPIFNKEDTQKIEALYQKAIEAMSSLGTYSYVTILIHLGSLLFLSH